MQLFVPGYHYQVRQKREGTLCCVSLKQFSHLKNIVWEHWNRKKPQNILRIKPPPFMHTCIFFFLHVHINILSTEKKSRKQRPGCQVCWDYINPGTLWNCDLFVKLLRNCTPELRCGFFQCSQCLVFTLKVLTILAVQKSSREDFSLCTLQLWSPLSTSLQAKHTLMQHLPPT